ncbi:MAG: WD40 repeat domain-containing protein, partial [Elusimicrobia bacterium]|nr:WD40 repeat domain-containing protein [Elusimicrobiota bacterium]
MKNVKSFVLLFAVILAAVGCCLAVSVGNEAGGATDTGKNSGVVRFRWAAGKSPVLNGLVRTFEDEGEMSGPMGVAFSPDGKYALSGCNTLKLWDIATGKLLRTFARSGGAGNSVAFSPDGKYALSGSYHDKTLTLWDIATGKLLHTFEGHGHSVTSVAFSPDGQYALSGSYDKTLKLWDIATGQLVRTFEGHGNSVTSVA